ncbi:TonB-dependent siderophore receptor [Sinirhodobacter populi]|uniref:TonB-dependent siderophore receptor n=1 Tax=Paenirhodobacter populi TaxID=2306993 RepID=A0A443K2Q3_9RHOB|nr:FepA family TonB-dependent siderophore receptor [Sinirhodobacter populi]RWR27038.1 TonB-dependent siderophore receptor [Sinirhodobacter populi]
MATSSSRLASGTALSLLMSVGIFAGTAFAQDVPEEETTLDTIVISAEDQIKQALGASTITAEDIAKQPVVNDIAEIVRKMPGVNLTGNAPSGQRGNQRQIDLRGMGPENTLILIDGKPVTSRNSVRMGRGGERDTRGDSNWVPAELVERIEVIRGPAAARYGSGAAGGVVNIITKRPEVFTGSIGAHYNSPENSLEGTTARTNLMLAGPIGQNLHFRVFGNYNDSEGDDPKLNASAVEEEGGTTVPAGREGVVNKDFGALLSWAPTDRNKIDFEFNFSRQGNKFAGDTLSGGVLEDVDGENIIGAETNRMLRRTTSVTHRGKYAFGESMSYLQYESTSNTRDGESTSGNEGVINTQAKNTIDYDSISGKTEWILPTRVWGHESMLTLGAEYRGESMDDPTPGPSATGSSSDQYLLGLYAEANIMWGDKLTLTPGMRYDYADTFGSNLSPSLNATYAFTDEWSMKVGIARAFKAPNLFQLNPNYIYATMGGGGVGCPAGLTGGSGGCYVMGNEDLKPERSLNKEIGFAYQGFNEISGSLTYFHNDFKDRISQSLIQATDANGNPLTYTYNGTTRPLLQWENTPKAVVKGLEGNFATPLGEMFSLNINFTKMIKSINKQTGNPLSLVPKHTVNASLDWYAREDLTFTLGATHYGEISPATVRLSNGAPLADTDPRPSYTLVNLGMKWDVDPTAHVSAGVTNLFDKKIYRTETANSGANTFNEPGRAFYVGVVKTF